MRPTKALGDASRPPSADPGTSLLAIVAILASFVAIAHPVATLGVALVAASGVLVCRTVRLCGDGRLCIPRLDRCYRVVPTGGPA